MRILVTAASFTPEISGVQRHALNLVRCLQRRPEISHVDLVVAPWQTKMVESAVCSSGHCVTMHIAPMDNNPLSRNLWHYRELPALADRLQSDVVHFSYPAPINTAHLSCPTVVTLHDLYPFEIPRNFRFPNVVFNRLILRHCLQKAGVIACVSEATSMRLRQYVSPSIWRKAVVIPNCVESQPTSTRHAPSGRWTNKPFLLSVSQHRKNKNLDLLIRAFHLLRRTFQIDSDVNLIIVGIDGPETPRIHKLINELDLGRSVLLLQGLSDPELQWCYGQCDALVLPSKTEGFGLPVAEGLLVGCRIICSDIPSFREVGGAHCCYVGLDKQEIERLAAAIKSSLQQPRARPVTLPHLSSETLADQYVRLYKKLKIPQRTADSAALTLGGSVDVAMSCSKPESRRDARGYF